MAAYDTSKSLIIDPVLDYSTYLGSSSDDIGGDIAVDILGHAYVTGATESSNFPSTTGAYDTSYNGGQDAFVAKIIVPCKQGGGGPFAYISNNDDDTVAVIDTATKTVAP